MITIFTPTYNREDKLLTLFNSLVNQTFKNFEWLIVDDGSKDQTKLLINKFILEKIINIRYIYQNNGGKHRAINNGVKHAKGELFFIVDSDDYLPPDALKIIVNQYEIHKDSPAFGGVAGRKSYFSGELVGGHSPFKSILANAIDIRFKHHLKGDLAEVFLTSVLKEFPFPEIENERFCPEALVWNRIAQKHKLLYFNQNIYHCEYLPDGLTAKIVKIRMTSPIASMLTYSELASYNIPFKEKIKAVVNYWRFAFNSQQSFIIKMKRVNSFYSIIGLPLGLMMYLKDKKQFG